MGMLNKHSGSSTIDVPTDSSALSALRADTTVLPHSYTQQLCSSGIIAASSPLYKKLSDITEHTLEIDAQLLSSLCQIVNHFAE